jgi:peptide/nickel transport system substrate-binding protein
VDFAVLGPVEARLDGKPVALGGVKPRALLAILLLARNQVVSRDRLIDGLWGERPPASAAHSLDHYVSRLRTTLGPDRVLRRPPGYVLRVEPGELDVDCFDELRRRGREELAAGRHAAAAATLSAALALWRGTALADVLYTPFAGEEAERLEERRLLAIEDRVEADLALGQARELVPELEALVAQHPYRERLVGQLMLALDRGGRKAEALEVYRSARQRLATELGLEPGHALRELERAILADEIALAPRAPRGAPPIRRRTAVALVVGLLVAGVAAGLAFAPHGTQSLVDRGDRIVALASSGGRLERTVSLPGGPSAVAADGSSVWVAEPGQNALLHVDASSGTVVDRIPLASQPGEVVLAGGGVWVASSFGGSVARIDRESGEITRTLELGGPTAIAVGDGGVFVAEAADRRLLELDPVHGNITRRVSLPFAATALAIAGGTAWVANYDTATLAQVELASGRAVASVHVGQGPVAVAAGPDGVWVANSLDGTISRIDPATDAVNATIAVGDGPADVELARGSVWVPDTYSGTVARVDARTGALAQTIRVGGRPSALAVTPRAIWAAVDSLGQTHRGGTLRMATINGFGSVDPALYSEIEPTQFSSLAYDTLVTFARSPGPAGLRLVPDLALALPLPADGGTTYAFRVRPGILYADGRTVRAQDFRRAIERDFRAGSPGTQHFTGLIGARACADRPARCDLARGIVTDDAAGSVVFHLTAPDPDFLYGLTSFAFSAPVPPGTPAPEPGRVVVPGTGPYRISAANDHHVRFTRNPFFREWSHAAQPDGNPDEVDWDVAPSHEAVVREIERGQADWTYDLIPPAELRDIKAREPDQLHVDPWFLFQFAAINTTTPPFDDVRVRRAFNYAIDRAKVVRMYGGRAVAAPTCQPLVPGLPGYVRYCPYTRDPRPDGRWSAPDLARARRLVAASGRRGALIDVWAATDELAIPKGLPAYEASVLRSIGFRTRMHSATLARLTPQVRHRHQLSVDGDWLPDYPAPSAYLPQFFGCDGTQSNGYYCDPRLDRAIARARALQVRDPRRAAALWTGVDHRLVDRAVWVPLINLDGTDLTSRRLKNFTFNPVWGFIADQAWVR